MGAGVAAQGPQLDVVAGQHAHFGVAGLRPVEARGVDEGEGPADPLAEGEARRRVGLASDQIRPHGDLVEAEGLGHAAGQLAGHQRRRLPAEQPRAGVDQ